MFFLIVLPSPHLDAATHSDYGEVETSSKPIGSPFFRHLAADLDVPLEKLDPFEQKGFGRAETVTIVLLYKITGADLKDYGKRRIDDKTTLEEFATEAGLDYVTLYKVVQEIKIGIEAKGKTNLPPPVYRKTKTEKDQHP